jgi:branched-subunit amino acid transport protein
MSALAVLLLAGLGTFAIRSSTVHLLHGRELSPRATRALAGAVPAGLAAMIVVSLATHDAHGAPVRAVALLVALLVARFTKNVALVTAAGMVTFWLLGAQVP